MSSSGGQVSIGVVHLATGVYCLKLSPNPGYYVPIVATIHGYHLGLITVNTEYGNSCNPYGGWQVLTANAAGAATDEWFAVGLL